MQSSSVALVYHQENTTRVDTIERFLVQNGVSVTKISKGEGSEETSWSDLNEDKVLVLLTNNFIRSEYSMQDALALPKNYFISNKTEYIVADGEINENGDVAYAPTQFFNAGQIVRHISYWQDRHLETRLRARQVSDDEKVAYEKELELKKKVTDEIGEYLNIIRHKPLYSLEENTDEAVALLLKRLKLVPQDASLDLNSTIEPEGGDVESIVPNELIEVSGVLSEEEFSSEAPEADLNIDEGIDLQTDLGEDQEIVLSDIPGIELLTVVEEDNTIEVNESVEDIVSIDTESIEEPKLTQEALPVEEEEEPFVYNEEIYKEPVEVEEVNSFFEVDRQGESIVYAAEPTQQELVINKGELVKDDVQKSIENQIGLLQQFYNGHMASGQIKKAKQALQSILSLRDGDSDVQFKLAKIYFSKNKYKKAIEVLKKIISSTPMHLGANVLLSKIYYNQSRFSKATEHLESVIGQCSDGANNLLLANLYSKQGKSELAVSTYMKAVEQNPLLFKSKNIDKFLR